MVAITLHNVEVSPATGKHGQNVLKSGYGQATPIVEVNGKRFKAYVSLYEVKDSETGSPAPAKTVAMASTPKAKGRKTLDVPAPAPASDPLASIGAALAAIAMRLDNAGIK